MRECLPAHVARSDGPRPGGRTAAARARSRRGDRGTPRSGARSRAGRSCRSSRRARRRAGPPARRASRIARLAARPARRPSSGSLRQRASGRAASVPRSEHGGSTSTRSYAPLVRLGGVGGARPRRRSRPCGSAVRRSASARPGWRSTADDAALVAHQRGQVRGLGRRARRRGRAPRSPGSGVERARDRHRGARLRHEQAVLPQRRGERVERRVEHERPRAAVGRRARRPAAAPRARRGASAACWRGRRPRRARCRPPSARAPRRRRARRTTARRSRAGASGAARPRPGVPSGSASTSGARLARRAAQDGVDEAGAAARRGAWRARPTRSTAACGGHAVQERELEHARAAARRARRARAAATRPLGERLDHVVERRAALDDAVGEAHRERAVARRRARRASPCSAWSAYAPSSNTRRTTA